VGLAAELSGAPRNALYQAALQHKDGAPTHDGAAS
jgi:hypothetical protein